MHTIVEGGVEDGITSEDFSRPCQDYRYADGGEDGVGYYPPKVCIAMHLAAGTFQAHRLDHGIFSFLVICFSQEVSTAKRIKRSPEKRHSHSRPLYLESKTASFFLEKSKCSLLFNKKSTHNLPSSTCLHPNVFRTSLLQHFQTYCGLSYPAQSEFQKLHASEPRHPDSRITPTQNSSRQHLLTLHHATQNPVQLTPGSVSTVCETSAICLFARETVRLCAVDRDRLWMMVWIYVTCQISSDFILHLKV